MTSGLRFYVLFVAALGAAALAQSLRTLNLAHVDPLMLVILIALAAAAQRMPVFLFRSSAISISFAAVIASYVLYGTEVAVIVSLFQAGVNAFTPRRKPLLTAFVCGLVVAAMGLATAGETWGTGYEVTRRLLEGQQTSLAFGPAKFAAALATALSGAPGGIFAPSLSVGAGIGQLVAFVTMGGPSGAIVLLGVAAYFTGVVRAPLTGVIIVMEMTAQRSMIVPLFITALVADWVSSQVCPGKLYHALSQNFSVGGNAADKSGSAG